MERYFVVNQRALAYAATSLGATMMNAVFNFYYVKVYLNLFHVSQGWFQVAQITFMIWNAVNDPLFGYIQDNFSFSWVKSRRHSILYGAPLFAVSFMVTWIPWGSYSEDTEDNWLAGLQLMFSLCFYDTLFTFVLLAQCALFAEMSQHHEDRVQLIRYSEIGSLIGSSSVFFTNLISNNAEYFLLFQVMCALISVSAFFCFKYTGNNALTQYDQSLIEENKRLGVDTTFPLDKSSDFSLKQQIIQIFTQRSFLSFVVMNFCQVYHKSSLSNFVSIICDTLISSDVLPSGLRSVFYGMLFVLPQVVLILGTPIVAKIGHYRLITWSFGLKILTGSVLFIMGPQPSALILFYLVDNLGASTSFALFNLCLSDIIDADKEKYNRKHPLSSMVFGLNALVTKPAQSVAPMISVFILDTYGYSQYKKSLSDLATPVASPELMDTMFNLTCWTSVALGVVQLLVFSAYTIRHSHILRPKYVETAA